MSLFDVNIREVTWKEARDDFINAEPELAKIIDDLAPGKAMTLLKVSYPFGGVMFEKSVLHLPTATNESIPLTHAKVPEKIKELLCYSSLPLGCVTNKRGIEVYREIKDRIHSVAFFNQGLDIGVWEFFEPPTSFSISCGVRSMMLLPRAKDNKGHTALQEYGITARPEKCAFEEWQIFREIGNNKRLASSWFCDVIFFTRKWADKINNDSAWINFRHFILKRAWKHTGYCRNSFLFDELWQSFFNTLSAKKIKPVSYVMDSFKHLISIVLGACIAYKPFTGNSKIAGPIDDILKVYLDVYKLKTYVPTIMLPCYFSAKESPVYYSLQFPTYWDSTPKSRDSMSAMRDLNYLIWLLDAFKRELKKGNIYHECIFAANKFTLNFDEIEFDYFHSDAKENGRIKPASLMPQEDKNLLYMPGKPGQYGEREFAERGTFVRGCVRISVKKSSVKKSI